MDDELNAFRVAFNDASDKKAVIACGVLAAQRLAPKTTSLQLLNPLPTPLDVVEQWSGKGRDKATRLMLEYKAFGIAIFLVAVSVFIIRSLFLEAWLRSSDTAKIVTTVGALIAIYAFATIVKRWISHSIERRVNQLDAQQALAIVLDQIAKLGAKNPAAVPAVMDRLRSDLRQKI